MERTLPGYERITIGPNKLGGEPCIRGHRFGVQQLLDLVAAGWTTSEIIATYPFLEPDDVLEALRYDVSPAKQRLDLIALFAEEGRFDFPAAKTAWGADE